MSICTSPIPYEYLYSEEIYFIKSVEKDYSHRISSLLDPLSSRDILERYSFFKGLGLGFDIVLLNYVSSDLSEGIVGGVGSVFPCVD